MSVGRNCDILQSQIAGARIGRNTFQPRGPYAVTAPGHLQYDNANARRLTESTGRMRGVLLLVVTCLFVAAGAAAPLSPAARTEIGVLMDRLETSACEFNRNGAWYTATEAKAHLLRKLKYLEYSGAVQSTEQFIELGASTSSITGQPYLVKCAKDTPVPSRSWLLSQLQAVRSGARAKSAQ